MKSFYDLPAPAKLNLFLHVTERRADGRHNLQSVFTLVDVMDIIHVERTAGGEISREDLVEGITPYPLPTDDLCIRAAKLLQSQTGTTLGAHIGLKKVLPAQAGMGGGSSDAATCLLALNRLWGTKLDRTALMKLGGQLGADVPFFVHGTAAWVEGTGDVIQSLELKSREWVVVKPNAGAETGKIFNDTRLKRDTKRVTMQGFAEHEALHIQKHEWFGANDLQAVAQRHCPEIVDCLRWMEDQGLSGRMTGSGSAVFAQRNATHPAMPAPGSWWIRECSSVVEHPLRYWVDS
jgi:4-diphosphocytidyl-2-C-methyl-D-erythritol kinase